MSKNILNSTVFKERARAFLQAADAARTAGALDIGSGFAMRKGIQFQGSPSLWDTLHQLKIKVVELIGPTLCTQAEAEDAAWEAAISDTTDVNLRVKEMANEISKLLVEHTVICSNFAVLLQKPVRSLTIGPVKIRSNRSIATELKKVKCRFELLVGDLPDALSGPKPKKYMTFLCWYVNVTASRRRAPEEGLFVINAAVSYLRLAMLRGPWGALFPGAGDIEQRPSLFASGVMPDITMSPDGIFAGGRFTLKRYEVGKEIRDRLNAAKHVTEAIFKAKQGTVGERMLVGLHWLARCRQSETASERFLFAFTAIEALLSSNSTSAPVVQTVARRAAYLTGKEAAVRERIAAMTRDLYKDRSNLVHRGNRSVSQAKIRLLESLADILFLSMLRTVDLSKPFEDFEKSIENASYGFTWPAPELAPKKAPPF